MSECTIQYSKGERHFTLQASPKTGNLFFASVQVLSAILLFIFALFMMVTKDTISLNNISALIIIIIVMSAPLTSIYLRDKNFLDKVGSLGTELEKN